MEIVQQEAAAPAAAVEGAPAEAATPNFDSLVERFTAAIEPRFETLETALKPPEEPAAITDPNDPNFFDPTVDFGPDGSVTDEAQDRAFWAAVRQEAQTIAQQQVQEAIAPITAERRQEQVSQQADALEAKYPELTQEDVQNRVLDAAASYAQALGVKPELAGEVARSPKFIEVVYLAMKAEEQQASASAPGAAPSVPLETGGSAGPAAPTDQPDEGARLVALAQGQRFRLGT